MVENIINSTKVSRESQLLIIKKPSSEFKILWDLIAKITQLEAELNHLAHFIILSIRINEPPHNNGPLFTDKGYIMKIFVEEANYERWLKPFIKKLKLQPNPIHNNGRVTIVLFSAKDNFKQQLEDLKDICREVGKQYRIQDTQNLIQNKLEYNLNPL